MRPKEIYDSLMDSAKKLEALAAVQRQNEVLAYTYAHLLRILAIEDEKDRNDENTGIAR